MGEYQQLDNKVQTDLINIFETLGVRVYKSTTN